uniref:CCHC-type domain-containing protein n=4 Tax=Nothobranchius TaxID=28779 RepID=A0A1A8MDX0_9TELE
MSRRAMDSSTRWSRLMFDGDEEKYELWETKFLGHLRLQGLKDVVLKTEDEEDESEDDLSKNAEAYAELIQFLDDKSLLLVMRDAADDGRKALAILRDHYAGKGKPRIISLYTELTSLQKLDSESVTDYVLRAESAISALRSAGETLSDGLLIAMVLKGLPASYKPFSIHVTQSDGTMTFTDFKSRLRSYEETEKIRATAPDKDDVMKARVKPKACSSQTWSDSGRRSTDGAVSTDLVCYRCGKKGHKARECYRRKWCGICKNNTHNGDQCRRRNRWDDARTTVIEDNTEYAFRLREADGEARTDTTRGIMVDTGATSHIVTDPRKFRVFDDDFESERHSVELADGTRCRGVAERRGEAVVYLLDNRGRQHKIVLKRALYVPSYPQDIFSVKAATTNGATVTFRSGKSMLEHPDGTIFPIHESGRLYYLRTLDIMLESVREWLQERRNYSLFILHPNSRVREIFHNINDHRLFELAHTLLVLLSCSMVCVENPDLSPELSQKHNTVSVDFHTLLNTHIHTHMHTFSSSISCEDRHYFY